GTSSTADLPGALEKLLARFPGGVDVIPASALDRHSFSTLRTVVLVLDTPPDLALLRKHYPSAHPLTAVSDAGEHPLTLDALAAAVAQRLGEKLVRRHPHVFEGVAIEGGDLLGQWERIKREERAERRERANGDKSVLGGVPKDLPALFAAERLQERAARVRMVPPRIDLPVDVDDPEFLGELLFDLVG